MAKVSATKSPAPAVVNLFAKAAQAAPPVTTGKAKKETVWRVDGRADDEAKRLENAIHTVCITQTEMAALKNKDKVAKGILAAYAEDRYVDDYARLGIGPETPMTLSNSEGESVTYVVQDRSTNTAVSDEQAEQLKELLGEDAAAEVIIEKQVFSFDPNVLTPELLGPVGAALGEAITKLVSDGTLTAEQAGKLLKCEPERRFSPGIVDRLAIHAGRDRNRIQAMLHIMGASCTRYIK